MKRKHHRKSPIVNRKSDQAWLLEQIAAPGVTRPQPPFSLNQLIQCSLALQSCLYRHGTPLSLPSELLPPLP
jgi:hypothetical protein